MPRLEKLRARKGLSGPFRALFGLFSGPFRALFGPEGPVCGEAANTVLCSLGVQSKTYLLASVDPKQWLLAYQFDASKPIYVAQPMWCNLRGATCVVLSMRWNLCGASYVVQSTWCNRRGAIYVAQSMWSNLCGEFYMMQSMWSTLCGAIHVLQSMWCHLCGAVDVVQSMWCD